MSMSHTDTNAAEQPTATGDVPAAVAMPELPDDTVMLKRMIAELLATLNERERDYAALQHRLGLLLRRLYGPRNERVDLPRCGLWQTFSRPKPTTSCSRIDSAPRRR